MMPMGEIQIVSENWTFFISAARRMNKWRDYIFAEQNYSEASEDGWKVWEAVAVTQPSNRCSLACDRCNEMEANV